MQNRKASLIIKNASQLVTLHDPTRIGPKGGKRQRELNIIKNGAVAVSGKRIIAIGETNKLLRTVNRSKRCKVIDAGTRVVTPGLVDPHTHPVYAGDRSGEYELRVAGKSYLEIAKAGGGINATVKAVRKASKKQLIDNGRKVLNRMLAFGTTTA
jgi:imidazolonepropionase